MWCHIQHNAIFVKSLRVQLFIIFSFQNQKKKKKLRGLEGLRSLLSKSHILKKWQYQNFCSWSQNWFYATFFPLFSFYWLSSVLVGWDGADAFKLFVFFFSSTSPQQRPPFSDSVLNTLLWCCRAKDLSHEGGKQEDHLHFVIRLPSQREKSHTWTSGACLSPSVSLLLCGSKTSVGVWNINRLSTMNLM